MRELIIPNFFENHNAISRDAEDIKNNDEILHNEADRVIQERKELGLNDLVNDLECVIINTEPEDLEKAVYELMDVTGLDIAEAFEDENYATYVLTQKDSADFLVRARKEGVENPFYEINIAPTTEAKPNARLETLVFGTPDIQKYYEIQKDKGVQFLSDEIMEFDNFRSIETIPSSFTGNSIGLIEWKNDERIYMHAGATPIEPTIKKPQKPYLKNIKYLDHAATRVRAKDRDAAIIEFMELTNYNFDFAIYVKHLNSITNVARLSGATYAMVFTTGISGYKNEKESGPTEKYIKNYGTRVHHMAFHTENIEETFEALKENGMEFLLELVGAPNEGLKQTFTKPSSNTFLVNEYIHRYGDFDGFFTRSNVTDLTKATEKQ